MNGWRGVALVEVVVALLVVAVGWMALLGLHTASVRIALGASLDEEARWTLLAVADSLDLHGAAAGRLETDWGRVEWASADGGVGLVAWDEHEVVRAELWTLGAGR